MRKQILYATAFALMAIIHACSTPEQKLLKKIKLLESEIYNDSIMMMDREKARNLAFMYVDYASLVTDSLKAADYLFRAGDLSMNAGYPEHAIEMFSRIRREYPDYAKSPECLFLMAFVFENQLSNYTRAEYLYRQFTELYPDHELADDAEILIQYLGKSPEELLKEFEKKNSTQ